MSKILFWSGFGLAVRFWQLGIEMRPFFGRNQIVSYTSYAAVGGAVGYYLMGVEKSQVAQLNERRTALIEKRRRQAARNGETFNEELYQRPVVGPAAIGETAV